MIKNSQVLGAFHFPTTEGLSLALLMLSLSLRPLLPPSPRLLQLTPLENTMPRPQERGLAVVYRLWKGILHGSSVEVEERGR